MIGDLLCPMGLPNTQAFTSDADKQTLLYDLIKHNHTQKAQNKPKRRL